MRAASAGQQSKERQIPLRANADPDPVTLVTVNDALLLKAYQDAHRNSKLTVDAILASKNEDDILFLENYCFFILKQKKIALLANEAIYFVSHKKHRVSFEGVIVHTPFSLVWLYDNKNMQYVDRLKPIRLQGGVSVQENHFPSIFAHQKDKAAVLLALTTKKPTTIPEAKKQFEVYRSQAIESRQKTLHLLQLSDKSNPYSMGTDGLSTVSADHIYNLLAAKDRRRYFRGIRVVGDLSMRIPTDLRGVDFGNCIFEGDVDFTGCDLTGANLQGAIFRKKLIVSGADIRKINLKDTRIEELHVNLNTADKTRFFGGVFSEPEKNAQTKIISMTHVLDATHFICIQSNEIFLNGKACVFDKFLENFAEKYTLLQTQGGYGDQLKELTKKPALTGIQKIEALIGHAKKDPKSRTLKALKATIEEMNKPEPPSQYENEASFASESTPRREREIVSPVGVIKQRPSSPFDSLADEEVDRRRTVADAEQRELEVLSVIRAEAEAEPTLRHATSSLRSPQFMGSDDNSPAAKEKRKQALEKLLSSYRLLKSKNKTQPIDDLLKQRIFPQFLHYVIYGERHVAEGGRQTHFLRYSYIEALFKEAAVPTDMKKIASLLSQRRKGSCQERLFLLPTEQENFSKECQKAWAKTPLADLASADCADKTIASRVAEKMQKHAGVAEPERTGIEKQYYIAALMEGGHFEAAEREAAALRAAWPEKAFDDDQHHIFSTAVNAIMKKWIDKVKTDLAVATSVEDERSISTAFDRACQPERIKQVFERLVAPQELHSRYNTLYTLHIQCQYFKKPVLDGIHITSLIKNIAKKVITKKLLLPNEIKSFFACVNDPFVWMGSDSDRRVLQSCLGESARLKDQSALCGALADIIAKAATSDVLMASRDRDALMASSVITPNDFKNVVNALLNIPGILEEMEKKFSSMWDYKEIKDAVTKTQNPEGVFPRVTRQFLDPKLPDTCKKISGNKAKNFIKLEQAKQSYEMFECVCRAIQEFSYNFNFLYKSWVACDITRASYETEKHPLRALLPISKIEKSFESLERILADDLVDLGSDAENTFGTAVRNLLKFVSSESQEWKDKVKAVLDFEAPTSPVPAATTSVACSR